MFFDTFYWFPEKVVPFPETNKTTSMKGFYQLNQILNEEIKKWLIFCDFTIKKEYSIGSSPSVKVDGSRILKNEIKFIIVVDTHVLSAENQMAAWCKRALCIMDILRNLPVIECHMKLRVDYNPTKKKSNRRLSNDFYKEMGAFFVKTVFAEMVAKEMKKALKANKVPWNDMPLYAFTLPDTITISGENTYFKAIDGIQNIADEMKKFLRQNTKFIDSIQPTSRKQIANNWEIE